MPANRQVPLRGIGLATYTSPGLLIALQMRCYYYQTVVDDRWSRDCGVRGKSEHMKAACRAKARATDDESRG
jgi:hypothetical protein